MGTFNFSRVAGVSVGVTMPIFSDEDIAEEIKFWHNEQGEDVDEQFALDGLIAAANDEISRQYNHALKWRKMVNDWVNTQLWRGDETDHALSIGIEEGYYDGFQLYIEDNTEAMIDEVLAETEYRAGTEYWFNKYEHSIFDDICGFKNTKELRQHARKVENILSAALCNYAYDYGLGFTSGGWCGGVSYDNVKRELGEWLALCDSDLWEDFLKWCKDKNYRYF